MGAYSICCAQQTGIHRIGCGSTAYFVFLSMERADTYRHKEYDRRIVLPIPSFSWSCPAESATASPAVSPISIYLLGSQVDTETRPIRNTIAGSDVQPQFGVPSSSVESTCDLNLLINATRPSSFWTIRAPSCHVPFSASCPPPTGLP
jgi:hypothetical protein